MQITILGAAREVTGSCYVVEAAGHRFLVDCGMFQGGADAYRKNRAAPQFDPATIEFVLLTHAHIDHSGLLPLLAKRGLRAPVYATSATCDLLGVMLPDAAFVQERESGQRRGGRDLAPLYTVEDASDALSLLHPVVYDRLFEPCAGVRCRLRDAGHILGSAILELWIAENGRDTKVVFSGDIGQRARPVVRDPTPIDSADVLIVESTYGNRLHKTLAETEEELSAIINDTLGRGRGNVVIPAFAVGRTQEILHVLADLARRGRVRRPLNVYVDSPMATRATEVTLKHPELIDDETRELISWGSGRTGHAIDVRFTESVEDSARINSIRHGAIIISASGMCDAGRIRHHLRHNLSNPGSSVVFTGFQAMGTLGRRLVDGEKRVRLFGEEVAVRARICTIGGLSAHADQQGLLGWLRGFKEPPRRTWIVHGESAAAAAFADAVHRELGWTAEVPMRGAVLADSISTTPAARSRTGEVLWSQQA